MFVVLVMVVVLAMPKSGRPATQPVPCMHTNTDESYDAHALTDASEQDVVTTCLLIIWFSLSFYVQQINLVTTTGRD